MVPPRVFATFLRTICNGWVTARRFQRQAGCILGCEVGSDSLEHYAICRRFHGLSGRYFGIHMTPVERCLEDLLGIAPYMASLPAHLQGQGARESAVALRALAAYALYRVHCGVRHGTIAQQDVGDAFGEFGREGTRCCPRAASLVCASRSRAREDDCSHTA